MMQRMEKLFGQFLLHYTHQRLKIHGSSLHCKLLCNLHEKHCKSYITCFLLVAIMPPLRPALISQFHSLTNYLILS